MLASVRALLITAMCWACQTSISTGPSDALALPELPTPAEVRPVPDASDSSIEAPRAEVVAETPKRPKTLLVLSETRGFRHASIGAGTDALKALGEAVGLSVTAVETSDLTAESLAAVGILVLLSTTGDFLSDSEQIALLEWVRAGGRLLGIHAAADAEYEWPEYEGLLGAWFDRHPATQPAELVVVDADHPATAGLPARWARTDEWYDFRAQPSGVRVLLALDEATYSGGGMGTDHPIAWCHSVGTGRVFYTGLGHTSESFEEPLFRTHLSGALAWLVAD